MANQYLNDSYSGCTQPDVAFDKLITLTARFEELLAQAIREAHAAQGITKEAFIQGLYNPDGTGWDKASRRCTNDKPILPAYLPMDDDRDPYSQLDLRTSLKYLYFGGLRIDSRKDGQIRYAQDQDAFFRFFGIDHEYRILRNDANHRGLFAGDFSYALFQVLRLHNSLRRTAPECAGRLLRQTMPQQLTYLMTLVQPLCDRPWAGQEASATLLGTLFHERIQALDAAAFPAPSFHARRRIPELGMAH